MIEDIAKEFLLMIVSDTDEVGKIVPLQSHVQPADRVS